MTKPAVARHALAINVQQSATASATSAPLWQYATHSLFTAALVTLLAFGVHVAASASTCYGSVARGKVVNAVQMPARGVNFRAYSALGVQAGRTYVHQRVRQVTLEAYAALAREVPGKLYVYGETGLKHGGPIPPHKTHQNGTSIDFMVPVRDRAGRTVPLPGTLQNSFGYGIEFDADGRAGDLAIDFDAMGEHLYQLALAAQERDVKIQKVIFDPALTARLLATRRGPFLRHVIPFMQARPWIRHDEHYHVDFGLDCAQMAR